MYPQVSLHWLKKKNILLTLIYLPALVKSMKTLLWLLKRVPIHELRRYSLGRLHSCRATYIDCLHDAILIRFTYSNLLLYLCTNRFHCRIAVFSCICFTYLWFACPLYTRPLSARPDISKTHMVLQIQKRSAILQ